VKSITAEIRNAVRTRRRWWSPKRSPVHFLIFAELACLQCMAQPATDSPSRDPSSWRWVVPDPRPLVTHGVIHSNVMDRDVGYNIYLPPAYDKEPQTRFPVVYFLHGAGGNESSDTSFAFFAKDAIEAADIGSAIYVFVNGGAYSGYRDNAARNLLVETYFIEELIPAIDARYRTFADREGRALVGFSMGGGASVRLALKFPERFAAAASISGSISPPPDNSASPVAAPSPFQSDDMYDLVSRNSDQIRHRIGLFFSVGDSERAYARHPPLMEHLDANDIEYTIRVQPGLRHDLGESSKLFGAEIVRFIDKHIRTD
jgi:enterochelin esterase-like enzyme